MFQQVQKELGERIKQLMAEEGLSDTRFAAMIGMDRGYLGGILNGRRNASLEKLCDIAEGLGLSLEELFCGVGPNGAAAKPYPPLQHYDYHYIEEAKASEGSGAGL